MILRNSGQVLETILGGGGSRVNVVWCGENIVAAGNCKGKVTIWSWEEAFGWKEVGSFQADDGVIALDGETLENGKRSVLVVGNIAGSVEMWCGNILDRQWERMARTKMKQVGALVECVALRSVDHDKFLVAVGGTMKAIDFFVFTFLEKTLMFSGSMPGHTDWVRSLAFTSVRKESWYLASGCADGTARVWQISCLSAEDEKAAAQLNEIESLGPPKLDVAIGQTKYRITADALLDEHTKAVLSVSWNNEKRQAVLLTSSLDSSTIVWYMKNGRWMPQSRLGLLGGSGSTNLGFYGSTFASKSWSNILAHTFNGALHCWGASTIAKGSKKEFIYTASAAPSGHFGIVSDIAWSPDGSFLLSCSEDKTTRLWGCVSRNTESSFVEWARPQVHGHPIRRLAFTRQDGSKFASCSEEKVIRLFQAPNASNLATGGHIEDEEDAECRKTMLPALGLSNKAIAPSQNPIKDTSVVTDETSTKHNVGPTTRAPPLEEDLMQGRLWPEIIKLYGHGNDVQCLTSDLENGVIASASRATKTKDAAIILWDADSLKEIDRLSAHDLTVNQICFAPDKSVILTVSRDRSFSLFTRLRKETIDSKSQPRFMLIHRQKGAHKRLLYCGAWSPDGAYFATGARDRVLKIFTYRGKSAGGEVRKDAPCSEAFDHKFHAGVSALDFCAYNRHVFLAVGFDDGSLAVAKMMEEGRGFASLHNFSANLSCDDRVTRVLWRPNQEPTERIPQIAVSSNDHSVRLFDVAIT